MLLGGVALIALIADACLSSRPQVTHDWRGSGRFALWATALSMFQSTSLGLVGGFVWLGADAGAIPWAAISTSSCSRRKAPSVCCAFWG